MSTTSTPGGTPHRICLACRVAVLSRYNSEPLCGPCARAARESSAIVPVWVWDSVPLREALARVDLAAVVAIVRIAAGLSQLELATLVPGWSQPLVSLTERGLRDTVYDIRNFLVFADTVGMPRSAIAELIHGDPGATLERDDDDDVVALRGVDAVNLGRRKFGTLVGGLTALAMLPVPARVDRAHVRYLQSALVQLRAQGRVVGGGAVLPEVLGYFVQARRMLDESDYSATIGRELLVVTTDLGSLGAFFAFDANDQRLARDLYGQAALLAESADVDELRIHVYTGMVQQCTYLAKHTGRAGFAREALRYAERAEAAARHEPSPALHALISYRRSLAHAQLGDELAYRSAITTARRELDREPHEADPGWTGMVTHVDLTEFEGLGKAQLGAHTQAVRLFSSALEDAIYPRTQARLRALLAQTLVAAGDVSQAIEHALLIVPDLGTTMTSGRVLQNLHPVRAAAEARKAVEFCEMFDAAERALRPPSELA